LRDVAHDLGKRDHGELGRISERNAKQARLQVEIEEQIVEEMSQPVVCIRERTTELIRRVFLRPLSKQPGIRTFVLKSGYFDPIQGV